MDALQFQDCGQQRQPRDLAILQDRLIRESQYSPPTRLKESCFLGIFHPPEWRIVTSSIGFHSQFQIGESQIDFVTCGKSTADFHACFYSIVQYAFWKPFVKLLLCFRWTCTISAPHGRFPTNRFQRIADTFSAFQRFHWIVGIHPQRCFFAHLAPSFGSTNELLSLWSTSHPFPDTRAAAKSFVAGRSSAITTWFHADLE